MKNRSYNPFKWVSKSCSGNTRYKYIRQTSNPIPSTSCHSEGTLGTNALKFGLGKLPCGHKADEKNLKISFKPSPKTASRTLTSIIARRTLFKYVRNSPSPEINGLKRYSPYTTKQSSLITRSRFKFVRGVDTSKVTRYRLSPSTKIRSRFKICRTKSLLTTSQDCSVRKYRHQAVRKAVNYLKFRRKPICQMFSKFGVCSVNPCNYVHDPNYVRICPNFLKQQCFIGSEACPLAHVLDPCRLPQCDFFEDGNCQRDHCPYLHIHHSINAPICLDFARGRCYRGRTCDKRHVYPQKHLSKRPNRRKLSHAKQTPQPIVQNSKIEPDSQVYTPLPHGSLRYMHPAPRFIPLVEDKDDSC